MAASLQSCLHLIRPRPRPVSLHVSPFPRRTPATGSRAHLVQYDLILTHHHTCQDPISKQVPSLRLLVNETLGNHPNHHLKWSLSVESDSLRSHGSSIRGIFQARVLEWIAISFSRGSSRPRNWTRVSRIAGRRFTSWATREAWATNTFCLLCAKILSKCNFHFGPKRRELGYFWKNRHITTLPWH